MFTYYLLI
ncbi:hypothetical protein CGLO_15147 [Colletotrichum gloeosporioides Cg-14]|uniref:Uncharacterized protein n=1 Tax=Colletotrichum gloeosporioides (strain Cg-14) TaxID=1237896 RepID=T0JZD0_COLGC|nr:hypothetical protein CGLO_15147 [Colletotrichum gloeosporioides Cg-14]